MTRRTWYYLVGLFALAVPAALALSVFPTAMVDLSENFAGGRFFPLTTPEHPPMQLWTSGVLALFFPPSAFVAIVANQILNGVAIAYVYATLRPLTDSTRAALFALLFATCLYFVAGPLSYALGADTLQLPIWAAIVYHLARATETNRWRHWIGLAIWAAAGLYTKYSIGILFIALIGASAVVPDYRRQWLNPRLYVAIALGILIVLPHLIALRANSEAIANAKVRLQFGADPVTRLRNLAYVAAGPIFYLVPGWIIVVLGLFGRDFRLTSLWPSQPTIRFLQATCVAAFAVIVALVAFLGLEYLPRYDAPLFPLIVLAAAPIVDIDRQRWPGAERRVLSSTWLVAAAILVIGSVMYGFFTSHNFMQEPIGEAEAIVQKDWLQHYTCGPGYILGDRSTAHGMSMVGGRTVGIPVGDVHLVGWFDPAIFKARGAIIAYRRPLPADEIAASLPGVVLTREKSFTLHLLRTFKDANLTYHYAFVPPADCPESGGSGG